MNAGPPVAVRPSVLGLMLTWTMTMATINQFVVGTLAPFLTEDLEISRTQLGGLTAAPFLVALIASPIAGLMVDRLRDRRSMTSLFAIVALVYAGMWAAPSYGWLLVVVSAGGLAQALTNPVTNKLVVRHVPSNRRGVIIGIKQSGVQLGGFLAGILFPTVAIRFGWRAVPVGIAALAIAGAAGAALIIPGEAAIARDGTPLNRRRQFGSEVWALVAYAFLMGGGVAAATVYLPLYAFEQLDFTPALAGTTIAVAGLVAVIARIVWGRVTDHRDHLWGILGTLVMGAGIGTVLIMLAPMWWWMIWVGVAFLGTSAMAWNAVAMIAVVRTAGLESAGTATGLVNAGFFGGYVISPLVFGTLVDRTGSYQWAWWTLILMYLVAGWISWSRRGAGRAR